MKTATLRPTTTAKGEGAVGIEGMMTMMDMIWELFVVAVLLYGLALLGLAAVAGQGPDRRYATPDRQDAPIFVRRRGGRAAGPTVATRRGTIRLTRR